MNGPCCSECASCKVKFAFSEKNLVMFSNGKCTHPGDCAKKYQIDHSYIKVLSSDNKAYQGSVAVGQQLQPVNALG
ncbi:MAG: hypothetical protein AAB446_02610 [Patescibacteria group bacterium]